MQPNPTTHATPPLLTTDQVADLLGIQVQTLESWRYTKRYALPFVKVGRSVRYRPADVDAFIEAQTVAR